MEQWFMHNKVLWDLTFCSLTPKALTFLHAGGEARYADKNFSSNYVTYGNAFCENVQLFKKMTLNQHMSCF